MESLQSSFKQANTILEFSSESECGTSAVGPRGTGWVAIMADSTSESKAFVRDSLGTELDEHQLLIARLRDEETRCRAHGFDATADALRRLIDDMARDLGTQSFSHELARCNAHTQSQCCRKKISDFVQQIVPCKNQQRSLRRQWTVPRRRSRHLFWSFVSWLAIWSQLQSSMILKQQFAYCEKKLGKELCFRSNNRIELSRSSPMACSWVCRILVTRTGMPLVMMTFPLKTRPLHRL
eukprot:TRINITY_DN25703_c0_g1_i1.p1 TRINITY_DN25703_c0_g1~~TRINITY_DN25703_c0_g1_i1.p1  ORF type:complete len:238 (+),score=0.49 TRINITY_DN25703_c0_g1_i1:781-1494(+)